jgi:hypothetical protein
VNLRREAASGPPERLALLASGGTSGMLMGAHNGAVYKVRTPVQFSARICLALECL